MGFITPVQIWMVLKVCFLFKKIQEKLRECCSMRPDVSAMPSFYLPFNSFLNSGGFFNDLDSS